MDELVIYERPSLRDPALVLGFTGWMDGGNVSTGTVEYLRNKLGAMKVAEIKPLDFYILHFPISSIPISVYSAEGNTVLASMNPMEFAALFRTHCRIEDGVIEDIEYPENEFHCAHSSDLILFTGEEPHIRWGTYCECIFSLAEELGVQDIYFVGSVGSPVPHTREPKLRASVADEALKADLSRAGVDFGEYEGPSSLITTLAYQSVERGLRLRSLVVEVPHYPFLEVTSYPRSMLKAVSVLCGLIELELDLSDLRDAVAVADEKLGEAMAENEDFRSLVAQLEASYDREGVDDEDILRRLMGGLRLDTDEEAD